MLEIHPTLLLYQGIIFIIFVYLMYRFVYRPLSRVIQDRRVYIDSMISSAEKQKAEAEQLRFEYSSRLSAVEDERKKVMETAVALGQKLKEEIIATARTEANRLLEKARLEADKERRRAVLAAKAELGSLAVLMLKKFLKREITPKDEERMVLTIARDIAEEKPWRQ